MKIWKMLGCLGLLCVIICGCVVLGQSNRVAAESADPEGEAQVPPSEESTVSEGESTESSTTVTKLYTEGLLFRSNGDGTCAVAGLGSCTAACILIPPKSPAGDTVTEILPYAFAEGIVGAIELPASVTTLSGASFAGCARLAYVRVAEGSQSFLEYDGVLYTANGSTLLYAPAGRNAAELKLHPALTRIAAGAFADAPALHTVYFPGTTAQWHALIVGDGNERLFEASLKFQAT